MKIEISAFKWVPPFAQGLVRDLRARWALEEAELPYEAKLISFETLADQKYLARHPFGMVPIYQEGDGLQLFESGAILLRIADKSDALLPPDPDARSRAHAWMFAALNTIEPHLMNLVDIDIFNKDEEWAKLRRPEVIETVEERLQDLSNWLEGKEYLEGRFSVADLLLTTVLRIPRHTDLVKKLPVLQAYQNRCESRPAFKRALAAQLESYAQNAPQAH